ncbi:MAG: FHA domain-containing protein [Phycisphaerae bacterium]|nr:FHA domain-containing protein [Phycisphaerae bacterium]
MNANLVLLSDNGSYKTFALSKPVTVLGRRHDCNLRIPLPVVSRRHCQLTQNSDSIKLRDLGSRGGTFINGKKVDAEKDVPIKPGDYLRIGPLTFVCQIDGQPAKITPPAKAKKSAPHGAKPKSQKPAGPSAEELGQELDKELDGKAVDDLDERLSDELDDLDVSDSFINLDDLDGDAEDLKNP